MFKIFKIVWEILPIQPAYILSIVQGVQPIYNRYSGGFLNPLVTLGWFTVRLGMLVGPRIPAALVAYNLFSFGILKLLMPDYKKIVANEQEAEGKFKCDLLSLYSQECMGQLAYFWPT